MRWTRSAWGRIPCRYWLPGHGPDHLRAQDFGDTDQVGLGHAAIGKLADSYSRNQAALRGYYARRREVITRLLCQERLDYAAVEERHRIVFRNYFVGELRALEGMACRS